MENKKYEMTEETMELGNGVILHRIKALKDFNDVKAGELGGWIEKEDNLSHKCDCWVYDNSQAFDNARIYDNAIICGDSRVCGKAMIYNNAKVQNHADIFDQAVVHDNAYISGFILLFGKTMVHSNAVIVNRKPLSQLLSISGNTSIGKNAYISCYDDYITFDNVGSRHDAVTFYNTKDNGIYVNCGCFNGTLNEFKEKVIETHKDNKYAKEYLGIIEVAKVKLSK